MKISKDICIATYQVLQPSDEGKLVPEAYVLPFTVQDSGKSKEKEKDHKIIHYNNLLGTGDGEGVVIVAATKEYWKNSNNINVHILISTKVYRKLAVYY